LRFKLGRKSTAQAGGELFQELQTDTNGFIQVSKVLEDLAGIHLPLNEKNLSLMSSRLSALMRSLSLQSYEQYIEHLNNGDDSTIREFISLMTTNTTHFFRENSHFKVLKELLINLVQRNRGANIPNDIRIWCAASSTGQEPYSIAMTVAEVFASNPAMQFKILATDIDREALDRAGKGIYTSVECENIPPLYRAKYFDEVHSDGHFRVKAELRRHIEFAEFNLSASTYPFDSCFDVVFCRNVLIYFEKHAAQGVVKRLQKSLTTGGCLFLGHSESGTMHSCTGLTSIAACAYLKAS
jgi:chemotaxis protein methyltransferase CheR